MKRSDPRALGNAGPDAPLVGSTDLRLWGLA